jgi:hypothetical protein
MDSASERLLGEAGFLQDREHRLLMAWLGAVRSSQHRQLALGNTKPIDRAGQDCRKELKGLGTGSEKCLL